MVIPFCFLVEVGVRGGDNDNTLLAEQQITPFSMLPSASVMGVTMILLSIFLLEVRECV